MWFVYDNVAALAVAAFTALQAWLFGGTRSDVLLDVVPWLFVFLAEIALVFPQKEEGETSYDARERAWRRLKRDPAAWIALALVVILAIPFFNTALCPNCDAEAIAQGQPPGPLVSWLPYCLNRYEHLNVTLWIVSAFSAALATKLSLTAEGKRLALAAIVWSGFALAAVGFLQIATGAPGPLWQTVGRTLDVRQFFATWGYPNMAGDYFTTLFGISLALWRWRVEEVRAEAPQGHEGATRQPRKIFWRKHFYIIPALLFFFAAVNTLSRASIILVSSLAVLFFIHSYLSFTARMSRTRRVKTAAYALGALALVAIVAAALTPGDVRRELGTLESHVMLDRVTGRGEHHARVATRLWHDHRLFGCGGWGYRHLCYSKMTPEEVQRVSSWPSGAMNVHNDYLQFLCEHGLFGLGLLIAFAVVMVAPIFGAWRRLVSAARFTRNAKIARPVQIFALPAGAFFLLFTALATLIHAFGDCPFRSSAIITLFYVMLAAIPGFMGETPAAGEQEEHHHHSRHHHAH